LHGELGMTSWRHLLKPYLERPVLVAMLMAFASGLPLVLTGATLTFWLAESRVEMATIGLFALVGWPYTWKYLWSPLMDRLPLPVLTRLFGRRRAWLLLAQAVLVLSLWRLGASDPAADLGSTAFWAVMVAFSSASQDIVIDAYRAETLSADQLGPGSGAYLVGYRIGLLAAGAGTLYLAAWHGWPAAYAVMAALVPVGSLAALLHGEPGASAGAVAATRRDLKGWLRQAVVEPFAEFFQRQGVATALLILLFVMLYKLGDALLGVMVNPFYLDMGFTKTEVANVVKLWGFLATVLGGLLGGTVIRARGVLGALWICGVVQMLSNLVYVVQAWVGHDTTMLAATVAVENLAGGMGTAAFVGYLTSLCHIGYTATQYALLSSAMAQARTLLASSSGVLAEWLGWIDFFLFSTAAALPGLVLLLWLQRRPAGIGAGARGGIAGDPPAQAGVANP
jgi:PAT family beta-lactamase induction signal transducer AmpG